MERDYTCVIKNEFSQGNLRQLEKTLSVAIRYILNGLLNIAKTTTLISVYSLTGLKVFHNVMKYK